MKKILDSFKRIFSQDAQEPPQDKLAGPETPVAPLQEKGSVEILSKEGDLVSQLKKNISPLVDKINKELLSSAGKNIDAKILLCQERIMTALALKKKVLDWLQTISQEEPYYGNISNRVKSYIDFADNIIQDSEELSRAYKNVGKLKESEDEREQFKLEILEKLNAVSEQSKLDFDSLVRDYMKGSSLITEEDVKALKPFLKFKKDDLN